MRTGIGIFLLYISSMLPVYADEVVYQLKITNHLFYPDTIEVPAGVRFKLLIDNQDATPEEFESFELNREKVIMGQSKTSVFIGPLKAGIYPFFGEFNPETAQGKIIASTPPNK